MMASIPNLLTLSLGLVGLVRAQYDPALVGTWSTKSKAVVTGPGFYNPVADQLIEPELAGISYSFTSDGYFEEAYYRAIPNPTTPHCVQAVMQWQHGTYSLPGNGSITTQPFEVDGRQLTSAPCSYDNAVYIRFSQTELFKSYQVITDPYHNVPRLNLYKFDGSPMQPMYLMYSPPQMLPTQTLNPTAVSGTPQATGKVKRDGEQQILKPIVGGGMGGGLMDKLPKEMYNADRWWWAGVGLTALGTVMYMMPTSL